MDEMKQEILAGDISDNVDITPSISLSRFTTEMLASDINDIIVSATVEKALEATRLGIRYQLVLLRMVSPSQEFYDEALRSLRERNPILQEYFAQSTT